MPRGSITDQDREFVEVWEHVSPQTWGVMHLNARGDEVPELVSGQREFRITTEERMLTEDQIVRVEHDPFKNGAFRPVVVPDSITIETNPNALSEAEIREILSSASEMAFEENLRLIDSVATFHRMLEIGETMDALTMKRYKAVEARLEEARGHPQLEVKDPELKKFLSGDSEDRKRPTGMSGNYR